MRRSTLSFILLLSSLNAFCQVDNVAPIKGVMSKLQSFYSGNSLEKVYLHLDKPWYFAGDTLYFKAYVTFGEQHEPSKQSEVLYVDLINPENKLQHSIKLQVNNGLAWGDFILPDSLPKGNYQVRAYTKLMQHAIGTRMFEQIIPVESLRTAKIINKVSSKQGKPDMQFFPEGGDMIFGVTSRIAFKAISANGLGIDVKGNITDKKGDTITSFRSSHLGMGFFFLHPEDGKSYKANVIYADGSKASLDLPTPLTNAVALKVYNNDPDKLTIGLRANHAFYNQHKGQSFYILMNNGLNVADGAVKLVKPSIDIDLSKNQFRTGVAQLTLFDASGEPLSERLAFIQGRDQLKLNIASEKAAYSPYEKVSLDLSSKAASDSLVSAHFSVSVIDENKVPVNENNENTILTWLLLSSDIQGYIEQPNYYFNESNKQTASDLDLLMLTQGYRRFTWKQLLDKGYPPVTFEAQKGLDITVLIKNLQGKPAPGSKVDLASLDGGPMLKGITDSTGTYDFKYLCFTDSSRFLLKALSEKRKDRFRIEYLEDATARITDEYLPKHGLGMEFLTAASLGDSTLLAQLTAKYRPMSGRMLKEVKIKEKVQVEFKPIPYAGMADQTIRFENTEGNEWLSDHLYGLRGVVIIPDMQFPDRKYAYLSIPNSLGGPMPMRVMIDGVYYVDNNLNQVNFSEVEQVEVFRNVSASVFGAMGGNGVISITTRKGPIPIHRKQALDALQISAQGFYKAREFYSPKYQNAFNVKRTDMRSTIYWKPEIVTDKSGNASFEFYNAGGQGTYRVVIEGIDDKGNIGRQVYRYKVE